MRHGRGEIDIIAVRNDVVAICEVKTRQSAAFGTAGDAMTREKCRTVRLAAVGWAREHAIQVARLRFDVALITGTRLEIIEDAF
jgi:putative endonuclease